MERLKRIGVIGLVVVCLMSNVVIIQNYLGNDNEVDSYAIDDDDKNAEDIPIMI